MLVAARKQMLWASCAMFVAAVVSAIVLAATGQHVRIDVGGAPLVFALLAAHTRSVAQLLHEAPDPAGFARHPAATRPGR